MEEVENVEITCLICAEVASLINPYENLSGHSEIFNDGNYFRFQQAFSIFCKTLNVDQQIDESSFRKESLHEFIFGKDVPVSNVPCCEACFSVFKGLIELEEIIQDTLAVQRKLARNLEGKLLESFSRGTLFCDDVWAKIRAQLICCLKDKASSNLKDDSLPASTPEQLESVELDAKVIKTRLTDIANNILLQPKGKSRRSKGKRRNVSKRSKPFSVQAKRIKSEGREKSNYDSLPLTSPPLKPCSVFLKRLTLKEISQGAVATSFTNSNKQRHDYHNTDYGSGPTRKARRSKLKAFKFLQRSLNEQNTSDVDDQDDAQALIGHPITDGDEDVDNLGSDIAHNNDNTDRPVSSDREFDDFDNFSNNDNGNQSSEDSDYELSEPTPKKRRRTRKRTRKSVKKPENSSPGIPSPSRWRNKTNGIFYKIKEDILLCRCTLVSYTSENMTCLEPDCSVSFEGNDFDAFKNMYYHVENDHELDYSTEIKLRKCPLCESEFLIAPEFRHHLLYVHGAIKCLICEVCRGEWGHYVTLHKHFMRHHKDKRQWWEERKKGAGNLKERLLNSRKDNIKHPFTKIRLARKLAASTAKVRPGPETEMEQVKIKSRISTFINHLSEVPDLETKRRNRSNRYFFRVTQNIFLCRSSLVLYSPQESITCQEPNCGTRVEGSDVLAFQNILNHIDEVHVPDYSDDFAQRSCPLCKEEFRLAMDLRYHLKKTHGIDKNIVCEVCMADYSYPESLKKHYQFQHKQELLLWDKWTKERQNNTECNRDDNDTQEDNTSSQGGGLSSFGETQKKELRRKREVSEADLAQVIQQRIRQRADNHCYALGENSILYKYFVFQRSPSHVKCQREGCSWSIDLIDSYAAFEALRQHVSDSHLAEGTQLLNAQCPQCNEVFKSGALLRSHIMRKYKPSAICPSCCRHVSPGSLAGLHGWLHKNEVEKAAFLEAGGVDPVKLRDQKRAELPPFEFKCDECGKGFRKKVYLKHHKPTHLPRALRVQFKCPEENCDVIVISKSALKSHIERTHKPELITRVRICRICDKRFHFRDGERYRIHMRSHTKEKPWVCDICGKGFHNCTSFKKHTMVHSTLRLHQCEFCEMSYKYHSNLKRHRETVHAEHVPGLSKEEKLKHTPWAEYNPNFIGPRLMHPCEFCEKVFPLKSRMKKHLVICPQRRPTRDSTSESEAEDTSSTPHVESYILPVEIKGDPLSSF